MSFIYGKYPVQEFLKIHPKLAKKIWFISEDHLSDLANFADLDRQQISSSELARKFGLKPFESHQGLLLEIKADLNNLLFEKLESLIIDCSFAGKALLWLPDIQDGHNLGAIIRSSVALGQIGGIIIPSTHSVKITAAVAKVSAGAIFSMKFAHFHSQKNALDAIKAGNLKMIGIEKRERSIDLPKIDFTELGSFVLVFGSEEKGIPPSIRQACDLLAKIPQSESIDSLNLSVSAGIVLYEMNRQLGLMSILS